jgi:hypothetical protein
MSDAILAILITLICVQFIFIQLALRRMSDYRKQLKAASIQIARFHDFYWLSHEFGWIIKPFADYVKYGKRNIENVRYDIRVSYEELKQKIIEEDIIKKRIPKQTTEKFSINS